MNEVTELDLRMPEFRDPKLKLEDLEFDGSGQVVRKDRFESAMRKISGILHCANDLNARNTWTCDQVVDGVRKLINTRDFISAYINAPIDAEYYHTKNKEYVKDIDQNMLEDARKDPEYCYLVEFKSSNNSGVWVTDASTLSFIDVLVSISDLKGVIKNELS